ncbi:MAG: hypothetical protein ACPLKZ_01630 [Candidatus Bathyarchaeales archaeon]
MSQNTLAKTIQAQPLLALNMPKIDTLLPGFTTGDFPTLRLACSIIPRTAPIRKSTTTTATRGLKSNVICIDGGSTFHLYQTANSPGFTSATPKQRR